MEALRAPHAASGGRSAGRPPVLAPVSLRRVRSRSMRTPGPAPRNPALARTTAPPVRRPPGCVPAPTRCKAPPRPRSGCCAAGTHALWLRIGSKLNAAPWKDSNSSWKWKGVHQARGDDLVGEAGQDRCRRGGSRLPFGTAPPVRASPHRPAGSGRGQAHRRRPSPWGASAGSVADGRCRYRLKSSARRAPKDVVQQAPGTAGREEWSGAPRPGTDASSPKYHTNRPIE